MAGRAYGNVVNAGRQTVATASGAGLRRGPGSTKVQSTARSQANPQGAIRSTGQQVRGPDKGAGSS